MQLSMKCSVAVHCLVFIAQSAGRVRVTSTLLAQSTGCNPVVIRTVLSALKKAGILTVARGTGGAALSKEPAAITLCDIYTALEPGGLTNLIGIHPCQGRACPVAQNIGPVLRDAYGAVEDAIRRAMQSITLADLLDDFHRRLEAGQTQEGAL